MNPIFAIVFAIIFKILQNAASILIALIIFDKIKNRR